MSINGQNLSRLLFRPTQTENNLRECEKLIKKWCTKAEIFDTICFATSIRQEEAVKLASACGAMVVIGGKNSANSLHLAELCAELCANTQFVENSAQLDTGVLRDVETIGMTAGASAPSWIIKEVLDKMSDEIMIQENPEAAPVEEAPVQAVEQPAEEAAPAVEAEAAPAEKSFDEMLEDSLKPYITGTRSAALLLLSPRPRSA